MAVLNNKLQEKIDALTDEANDHWDTRDTYYRLMLEAWSLYPSPKENWNEAYNTAKEIFESCLIDKKYMDAQKWLDEMVKNNDTLRLSEGEVQHAEGKYYYETGDLEKAYKKLKYAVVEAGAGYRYFEGEDPKYLQFYKSKKK